MLNKTNFLKKAVSDPTPFSNLSFGKIINKRDSRLLTEPKPIKALVLGGGGAHGAYQVGILKWLVEHQPYRAQYDVISGNSVGGLNAATLCMFKIGEEAKAVDYLYNQWYTITKSDIYRDWQFPSGRNLPSDIEKVQELKFPSEYFKLPTGWGSILYGLFVESGMYCTEPLKQYLLKNLNYDQLMESDRELLFGVSTLKDFVYEMRNKGDLKNAEDAAQQIRAGASIPGYFQSIKLGDEWYVDGGVRYLQPIVQTIQKCLTAIYNDQCQPEEKIDTKLPLLEQLNLLKTKTIDVSNYKIVVDVIEIVQAPEIPAPEIIKDANVGIVNLVKLMYNMLFAITWVDNEMAINAFSDNDNIQINVWEPTSPLPNDYVEFDHDNIMKMIEQGYKDGPTSKPILNSKVDDNINRTLHSLLNGRYKTV
ncbi:hypothetical protein ABK040_006806 [Willaertia magna]